MSAAAAPSPAPAATLLDLVLRQRRDLRQYLRRQRPSTSTPHAPGAWSDGSSEEEDDTDGSDDGMGMDHGLGAGGGQGPFPPEGTGCRADSEEMHRSQPKRSVSRRGAMGFAGALEATEMCAPAAASSPPPGRSPRKRRWWGSDAGETASLPICRRGLEDAMDRFAAVVISDTSEDIQPEEGAAERSVRRKYLRAADVAEAHCKDGNGALLNVCPSDNSTGLGPPYTGLGRHGTDTSQQMPHTGPERGTDDDSTMSLDDL